jgi:hypothetical protein
LLLRKQLVVEPQALLDLELLALAERKKAQPRPHPAIDMIAERAALTETARLVAERQEVALVAGLAQAAEVDLVVAVQVLEAAVRAPEAAVRAPEAAVRAPEAVAQVLAAGPVVAATVQQETEQEIKVDKVNGHPLS